MYEVNTNSIFTSH